MMRRTMVLAAWIAAAAAAARTGQKVELLYGFESPAEMRVWNITSAGTRLVEEGVTQGNTALEITFDPEGRARCTTFGTMLTMDFVEEGGESFRINADPGRYAVTILWEQAGYWGGEQSKHTERSIRSGGRVVWSETRPFGAATALYQFEDIEPVGVDVWEIYMLGHLIKPAIFEVATGPNGIELGFRADAPWSCKSSALVVHKAGDEAARNWLNAQMEALAAEFRSRAVPLDPPTAAFDLPADAAAGTHDARFKLIDGQGRERLSAPIAVNVHDVTLERETDFMFGFYGLEPNRSLVGADLHEPYFEQTLRILQRELQDPSG